MDVTQGADNMSKDTEDGEGKMLSDQSQLCFESRNKELYT